MLGGYLLLKEKSEKIHLIKLCSIYDSLIMHI